jgi:hypothetical protein
MNKVLVADNTIWLSHIQGPSELRDVLASLADGELVVLQIDRVSSVWAKMAQGGNASPTPGLKPACDLTNNWWKEKYRAHKGQLLEISVVRT